MVDINFENLPPQQGFKIDVRKLGGYTLVDEATETEEEPMMDLVTRPLGTNDFHVAYIEGEPGQALAWHTHTPIMHQAYLPLAGRVEVSYRDHDGEAHSVEAGPNEIIYLPAGAHNKVKVVGEERLRLYVIERETLIPRVEQLVGDSDGLYDPKEDPEYGLEIDTLRGRVLQRDEEAAQPY